MNPMIIQIVVPLLLYLCIFISGLIISISLAVAKSSFNGDCPLYASFSTPNADKSTFITPGAESTCFYVIYMPVLAHVVYPFVMLIIYFYIFYRTFTGNDSAIKLIKPFIVLPLNAGIFILTFVAACIISTGRSNTCSSILSYFHSNNPDIVLSCSDLEKVPWRGDKYAVEKSLKHLVLGEATTWISLIWWLLLIIPPVVFLWRERKNAPKT